MRGRASRRAPRRALNAPARYRPPYIRARRFYAKGHCPYRVVVYRANAPATWEEKEEGEKKIEEFGRDATTRSRRLSLLTTIERLRKLEKAGGGQREREKTLSFT